MCDPGNGGHPCASDISAVAAPQEAARTPRRQRKRRGESQYENERALELAQKKAKRAKAWRIFDTVGADQGKLRGGSIRRQTTRARLQNCGQRGSILAPIGRFTA